MRPKINIDRKKVSREEIEGRREFDRILDNYLKVSTPFYKAGWFKLGSALLAAALITAFAYLLPGPQKERTAVQSPEEPAITKLAGLPAITPPAGQPDILYSTYVIPAAEGGRFKHSTGSVVIIPERAFTDGSGNIVEGDVEIRYREFHDPVDFFLSGIPMTYDTLGEEHHFESAGMVDISARQNGRPVFIGPGKELEIRMASEYAGSRYNLYRLDTVNGKWSCEGKDRVVDNSRPAKGNEEPRTDALTDTAVAEESPAVTRKRKELESLTEEVEQARTAAAAVEETRPLAPKRATKGRHRFMIEVDPKEFPEMDGFANAVFEVSDKMKGFNPKDAEFQWESVSLAKGEAHGEYLVTFSRGKRTLQVIAIPVMEGEHYDKAVAVYEERLQEYSRKLQDRKEDELRRLKEYERKLKELEAERERIRKAREEEARVARQTEQKRTEIYRVFSIRNFGIFNCDTPQELPRGNTVAAAFTDREGRPLSFREVCLVDRGRNAVFKYYSDKFDRFRYNPASANLIWAVTPGGRLAVFGPDDFSGVPATKGPYTFRMSIVGKEFASPAEFRAFFGI